MIEAVIFDMDGVLIDSEPLWKEAEIHVFRNLGIELTSDLCLETLGMRTDKVVEHWYGKYPWKGPGLKQVSDDIEQTVKELILRKGTPMEGYREAIEFFLNRGIRTGLASSSTMELIEAVLHKLGVKEMFSVIHSAEHEPEGKPHPAVYLSTAKKMGVRPELCLAIEDSLNGLNSARAAGMKTIVMPAPENRENQGFQKADLLIHGLGEINDKLLETLLLRK
jgi:mannitol-1-/sugar-/sorbitol-6-/2-deoxyglucose-6-phosphatase